MPSLTLSKSKSKITTNGASIALGPTKIDKEIAPIGAIEIPLWVQRMIYESLYLSLCKLFMNKVSSIIIFTQLVGSTKMPIKTFPLI